jgi:hypothetical protein
VASERRSSANEFIRGPKWRTRTAPARRKRAAAATVAVIAVVGAALMWGWTMLLVWLSAPRWVVATPWLLPTAGALVWTLARPTPAAVTDDDDDGWIGYSIRWALVGETRPRPTPVRVVTTIVIGAPIVWAVLLSGLLTLTGMF